MSVCVDGLNYAELELYPCVIHSWSLTVGGVKFGGGRRRGRGGEGRGEVSLSHQFETDLFFPAKVTSC